MRSMKRRRWESVVMLYLFLRWFAAADCSAEEWEGEVLEGEEHALSGWLLLMTR